MKIAHLLPASVRFPLSKHNGRYEWALRLAQRQAGDGHQVCFYAGGESNDKSKIVWKSVGGSGANRHEDNLNLIRLAFDNDHDIFHSHFDELHYRLADKADKPIVATQHWFPDQKIAIAARQNKTHNVVAVPSSEFMAKEDERLEIKHGPIIRQGIDLELFKPVNKPAADRLIFVGRIAPWKGVLEAVQISKAAELGLDIVGKLNKSDHSYWEEIEPLIDGNQIKYLGPKSQNEIAKLFANAKAFIFPSQAPEAAPQTPIEAQACGAPVIMSNVGATSEWLIPGKTGFIASTQSEFLKAIDQLDEINRQDCRVFAQKFDFNDLVASYYNLYESLI